HEEPIGKSDEEVNMHNCPDDPCWETRELYQPQVSYCVCPAYDCEIALVPVPEWLTFSVSCGTTPNDISDVVAVLDGRLSHSRDDHGVFRLYAKQTPNGSNDMGGVGNCARFWMCGHRQVWADNDLS